MLGVQAMGEWKIPDTNEAMERAGERFRVCTTALKEINEWLDREGENPPKCILVRAEEWGMTTDAYYAYWKTFGFLDPRQQEETHAIEDWAIHQVQPNWKRNPNPNYPKNWT